MRQGRAATWVALAMVSLSLRVQAAELSSTWGGGNGNWTDAGSWSNGVPQNDATNTYTALVDGGNPAASQVTIDSSVTIAALQTDVGDQVIVAPTGALTVTGPTISNAGQITLQGSSSSL